MKHYGDITKLNGADLPPVDIITGGSPCQDLSVAGKRAGLAGERSGLFMEQIRVIKEMRDASRRANQPIRPRFMVWENVPGAFSSNKGEDFRAVLEETAKVADKNAVIPEPPKGKWTPSGCIMGDGWSIAWRVHDAQFWGVPQRRKRISLVADFGGETAPEILFERKGLSGDIETCGKEGQGTAFDSSEGVRETGRAISFQERAGKPGGGKGILIQNERTGALSTLNNQPVCYRKGTHPHTKEEPQKWEQTEINDTLNAFDNEENRTPTVVVSQDAYDKFTENDKSASLKACGGSYGGVRELCDTVGALCARDFKGVGNQYVNEGKCVIQRIEQGGCSLMGEDITPTLISGISKQNGTTQDKLNVMVLNDQGGAVMNTSEDIAGALRAQEHGHQPIVYGISAYESNSMKSPNPHSGIYEADTTRTLDNNGGNPACNQGGMIVLEGNGSRPSHKGDGYAESEVSYTLNAVEQHAVCLENHPADSRVKIREDGVCQTLSGRMGTGGGNVPMVMENVVCIGNGQTAQTRISDKVGALNCMHDQQAVMQGISGDVAGTLDASYYKGCGERQGVEREVVASSVVRRLTPLECERLQGYPDHWTDIGEWIDSKGKTHKDADSPRYKALGNSIALPFWEWMAKRMAQYLPEGATMASLFSGIGGFELVFARAGVKPIWNSEIESFPEAVTTVHFGDDERGIKGDYERYL